VDDEAERDPVRRFVVWLAPLVRRFAAAASFMIISGLIAVVAWSAVCDTLGVPVDVLNWTNPIVGIAAAAGIARVVLPARRAARRAAREERRDGLAGLPPKDREELRLQRLQAVGQSLSGLAVLVGVVFTAVSLVYTARALRSSQDGQITERYTRAVEQLGNTDSRDVRVGGIYALGRIADDSDRDAKTVVEVLTTYIEVHIRKDAVAPTKGARLAPNIDVYAALTVISEIYKKPYGWNYLTLWPKAGVLDLHGLDLTKTIKPLIASGMQLGGADLSGADLTGVSLAKHSLEQANLTKANLTRANLQEANLTKANLSDANLSGANLGSADLQEADLRRADLTSFRLTPPGPGGYESEPTSLQGANLHLADLREIRGMTPEEIRKVARTTGDTKFLACSLSCLPESGGEGGLPSDRFSHAWSGCGPLVLGAEGSSGTWFAGFRCAGRAG
jgi:hypothetical protein